VWFTGNYYYGPPGRKRILHLKKFNVLLIITVIIIIEFYWLPSPVRGGGGERL
jgi:hypothetical protein